MAGRFAGARMGLSHQKKNDAQKKIDANNKRNKSKVSTLISLHAEYL